MYGLAPSESEYRRYILPAFYSIRRGVQFEMLKIGGTCIEKLNH